MKHISMHEIHNNREKPMVVSVQYPCFSSGEPRAISAAAIGEIAASLRHRLFGFAARPVNVAALAQRMSAIAVNGRSLRLSWDWQHAVHDGGGSPVLGISEHDPAEPATVFISLNGELLGEQPELLRSTAAHELGHALFDMPAAIAKHTARAFSSRPDANSEAQQNWREWRANEFMGAFLAPKHQLARALVRAARGCGLEPEWRAHAGAPSPLIAHARAHAAAFDTVLDALAEQFGVSQAFIAMRLKRYGFID